MYTEKGQVRCRCPRTGEERELAFGGFESDRNTLKYRCPAAAYDFQCAGRAACGQNAHCQAGQYGRIVRIKLDEHNWRIFTPTPYGSPSWKRGYRRRTALERINNRLDHGFEFEQHFIRGLARMRTRIGVALAVMMSLALGNVRVGRPGLSAPALRPPRRTPVRSRATDRKSMRSSFAAVPWADTG